MKLLPLQLPNVERCVTVLLPGPFIRYQVFLPFSPEPSWWFIDNFMQGYHNVHALARSLDV
jgi:hypothetical protein